VHEIGRGYSHHFYAACLQPGIALRVTSRPVAHIVARAVDFDREPRFGAIEVEHVRTDRMLPPKDGTAGSALAQANP